MSMRLLTVIMFSFFLSSVVEAIDASVQYRPGDGKADYRRYRPPSPVSEQSSSVSRQEDQFRSLIKKTVRAKNAVYKNAWSGTSKDLEAVMKKAEQNFGFESSKHLGRNATMLVPATLAEMRKEMALGNPNHWTDSSFDGAHGDNANSEDNLAEMYLKKYNNGVSKFIIPEKRGNVFKELNENRGREVVYDNVTGKIITNEKMGTWNFDSKNGIMSAIKGEHRTKDMDTHATKADKANQFEKDGDQYKYVGILYERDPNDPDKFYIIDGQTGLPMSPQQVAEMPTTLSDMWKDMGLVCVANDAADIVPPKPEVVQDEKGREKRPDRNNPNGDWDCCKCENPEDKDFCCKKCGKMSKWLAPKQDLEFLQFLNK